MQSSLTELSRALGPLRRALLNATRTAGNLPNVPEAHVEVLRLLSTAGPLTSAALAHRLQLARSTVSNLVKAMMGQGLLETEASPDDLRSVNIRVSEPALRQLQRYDEIGTAVLARAVTRLTSEEREALATVTPVLVKLTELLSERSVADDEVAPTK